MNEVKMEEFEELSEENRLPSRMNAQKRKRSKTTKKKPLFLPRILFALFFSLVGAILVMAFLFLV
ncbi:MULTISPECIES: hypothetical protein [Bacillaceae]|uniref:Uncharacterized protein n=2 Tax=Bacillaceae TaxID=186817 RepID=A0A9D5DQW9_9BACI|nr:MULTISPECIES: hypothetical protein [Bacillaceae]KQL51798.1 hypothetical protein AN965_18730 [Alkalicoccobacillus plakortidis]MBG9784467.1 hypothetical protein [Shouchella lehensis]RQW20510.1 hypothetical protein EH196_10390 [Bacillus sp. C1-1]TES50526.1 hypothetical protein E2L03_00930 [Shouchella lehensis]